jgi:nucleoside-diphosphate kinase
MTTNHGVPTHPEAERTLILFKPESVHRGIVGEILSRFERAGLKIVAMKMLNASQELALKHYEKDDKWFKDVGDRLKLTLKTDKDSIEIGKEVQRQLSAMIAYSPIIAMVLEGHNAIKVVRKMVGEQSPENSPAGTIRGDYSFDTYRLANKLNRPIMTVVHASGNLEDADREIALWFRSDEIHSWKRIDEDFLYLNNI